MDEFNKIKELSDDIVGAKEPSFQGNFDEAEEENIESPFSQEDLAPISMAIEKNQANMKWHFIALGAFVGVVVLALAGFFILKEDQEPDKIVTITATPEPVRVKPKKAGGIAIPDQDKLIYNRVREKTVKIEKLFPEPEKPVLPEIMLKSLENTEAIVEPEIQPVPVVVEQTPVPSAQPPVAEIKQVATKPAPVVPQTPVVPKQETLPLPKEPVKPVAVTPAPQKAAIQPAKVTPASTEFWQVQLMSTQKKASAEKAWVDISQRQKALLSNMSHDIVSAEIAGKGTFYRLQVGHFNTREQAATLCAKLKAQKQDCVPVKGSSK